VAGKLNIRGFKVFQFLNEVLVFHTLLLLMLV
jgi:hypothetical protein